MLSPSLNRGAIESICSSINSERAATLSCSQNQFSLLSYNILHYGSYSRRFPSLNKSFSHGSRLDRIYHEVRAAAPTVVLLQECNRPTFEEDIGNALANLGYQFVIQDNPKRKDSHTFAVVTCYKADQFTHVSHDSRSRILITRLQPISRPDEVIAIVNCHLSGALEAGADRLSQLKSALNRCANQADHIVIAGDFNSDPQGGVYHFLRHGSVSSTFKENGQCVSKKDLSIPFVFRDAYRDADIVAANNSQALKEDKLTHSLREPTFVGPNADGKPLDLIIDHIMYTSKSASLLSVKAMRVIPKSSDKQVRTRGAPSMIHPSDHLPVACVFQWRT